MTDLVLNVPDMSCGHCKAAVEGAVAGVDPQARVEVNLDNRTAKIGTALPTDQVLAALKEAGYEAHPA